LTAMRVGAQMHDFIFAAPSNAADDQSLIDATTAAGNVYYGLALTLEYDDRTAHTQPVRQAYASYLERTTWPVLLQGDRGGLYRGTKPRLTFLPLAAAAQGLGYLNIKPDP